MSRRRRTNEPAKRSSPVDIVVAGAFVGGVLMVLGGGLVNVVAAIVLSGMGGGVVWHGGSMPRLTGAPLLDAVVGWVVGIGVPLAFLGFVGIVFFALRSDPKRPVE